MNNISERRLENRLGGNFATHMDFMNRISVTQCPFDELQTLTGLTASDGAVIDAAMIPVNAGIPDNLKISNGGAATAANQGGIVTAEGTAVTGFIAVNTFVHDMVDVKDSLSNPLNAIQIREAGTHDPVKDTDGREVFGLLIRVNALADDTALAAAGVENVELCFVVNDGAGAYKKAAGGVTGDIEFNLLRSIAERYKATISLEGGNATGMDIIVDLSTVHFSDLLVTAPFAADEEITIASGAGSVSGTSTRGGDAAAMTLNVDSPTFILDNTCICTIDGVKGGKGVGRDFVWISATVIKTLGILDIGDRLGFERKYA